MLCAHCKKKPTRTEKSIYCGVLCARYSSDKKKRTKNHAALRTAANVRQEKHTLKRFVQYGGWNRGPTVEARFAFLRAIKDAPCMDCGGWFDPVCMDWDHRDPSEKTASISSMRGTAFHKRDVLKEMAKCDLVCSNCHRIRTMTRKRKSKYDYLLAV